MFVVKREVTDTVGDPKQKRSLQGEGTDARLFVYLWARLGGGALLLGKIISSAQVPASLTENRHKDVMWPSLRMPGSRDCELLQPGDISWCHTGNVGESLVLAHVRSHFLLPLKAGSNS